MSKNGEPAVIIMSGGLDSVTLLHVLINTYDPVHILTFLYGQKHNKEIQSAKYFVRKLGLNDHMIIDLNNLQTVFGDSTLTSSKRIPHLDSIENRTSKILKQTVVPFRNAIFLSIAVAYASARKIKYIFYGAHKSDTATYPDCRPEFIESFEASSKLGVENNELQVIGPFVDKTKSDIVKLGTAYGVDFSKTWSCYEGKEIHCGVCPSCYERKNAFRKARIKDDTRYST
jgi:7-cyano-7-deazaguanine synthase